MKIDNAKATSSLEEGGSYKFLGVLSENVKQEDRTVFFNMQRSCTCKGYLLASLARCETTTELLRRTSILLITSSNVFHVDPDLALADLQQLDREARKVVLEKGGNHPLGSVAQLYISRRNDASGLRSVEV